MDEKLKKYLEGYLNKDWEEQEKENPMYWKEKAKESQKQHLQNIIQQFEGLKDKDPDKGFYELGIILLINLSHYVSGCLLGCNLSHEEKQKKVKQFVEKIEQSIMLEVTISEPLDQKLGELLQTTRKTEPNPFDTFGDDFPSEDISNNKLN